MNQEEFVFPRISAALRDEIFEVLELSEGPKEARQLLDARADDINYRYPSLHVVEKRLSVRDLLILAQPIREAVFEVVNGADAGYGDRAGVEFDAQFSLAFHENFPLSISQVADVDIWGVINTLVFGDLMVWRWRDRSGSINPDRYNEIASNVARSAFSRLWHRVQIFGPEFSGRFSGEILDQILERPSLREDSDLARALLSEIDIRISKGDIGVAQARKATVLLSKLLLRRFATVESLTLTREMKSELVHEEFEKIVF